MAWTAGATVTTGDLITAAQWNSYLGAAGSVDYLKSEVDTLNIEAAKHDDCSHTEPTRAMDTIYQNGSKTRIVTVAISFDAGENIQVLIGSGTPPATAILIADNPTAVDNLSMAITFPVPANWYYEIETPTGAAVKQKWHEFDLM